MGGIASASPMHGSSQAQASKRGGLVSSTPKRVSKSICLSLRTQNRGRIVFKSVLNKQQLPLEIKLSRSVLAIGGTEGELGCCQLKLPKH